jgi:membrane associated rhomboid family serine protease
MPLDRNSRGFSTVFGAIPFETTRLTDIPPLVPFPVFFTLFTSVFLHNGFWHIRDNGVYLWAFGENMDTFRALPFEK